MTPKDNLLHLPEKCLVLLIGGSSAGKSTLANRLFEASEIVSSDDCRRMVANDENVLDANDATFAVLHLIVRKRLERGLFTVVDATNLHTDSRKDLIKIARENHLQTLAIVLNLPTSILKARNATRPDRQLPVRTVVRHQRTAKQSIRHLSKEGIRYFREVRSEAEANELTVVRTPMPSNFKDQTGPFDLIGDVHGCLPELLALLAQLGYAVEQHEDRTQHFGYTVTPPAGRRAIFVGDLVDRGPASNEVLRLVMSMLAAGTAYCVAGNHDDKLRRYLQGRKVTIAHGLQETIDQLDTEDEAFRAQVLATLQALPYHLELDGGQLLVAHAGLAEHLHGRIGGAVREFCLYGQTTGQVDADGLPERYPWARDYQGKPLVVYGHTPTEQPTWQNRTLCLDTGCVFGGTLTALRYPEKELVSVPARATYAETKRSFKRGAEQSKSVFQLDSIYGRQHLSTPWRNVTIKAEQSAAALETMSRFAVDPRQLIYLPPTMSPPATSRLEGFLEHPAEAFAYYREKGVQRVVCQEKHMGSRAVVVIGKDADSLAQRFHIQKGLGWILTRTGRAFFADNELEQALLTRWRDQLSRVGFWERHGTDWVLLDAELMPWSAKAKTLLQQQYAATAAAGSLAMEHALISVQQAQARGLAIGELATHLTQHQQHLTQFRAAYQPYCWEVNDVNDIRLAPFHLLATEGCAHTDKGHDWHLNELERCCTSDEPTLQMTRYRWVDLADVQACAAATDWWLNVTEAGGEGMVVKPATFVATEEEQLLQPALKVRGREYLRLIYGPDYTLPDNLQRLRKRSLGKKRRLAEQEFTLGLAALQHFVQCESLNQVHRYVFGVLALESEAVDVTL
ncbi:MAG: polynucleotide kinase-phosphatase [Bacteroidota bacterium]